MEDGYEIKKLHLNGGYKEEAMKLLNQHWPRSEGSRYHLFKNIVIYLSAEWPC